MLCGAFIAVFQTAIDCHYSTLTVLRDDGMNWVQNLLEKEQHIDVLLYSDLPSMDSIEWRSDTSFCWTLDKSGRLAHDASFNSHHVETETRISYTIQVYGAAEHSTFVPSCDSY